MAFIQKQGLSSGLYGTRSRGSSHMESENHMQQVSLPTGEREREKHYIMPANKAD
jgi:hypothetical protein